MYMASIVFDIANVRIIARLLRPPFDFVHNLKATAKNPSASNEIRKARVSLSIRGESKER